MFAPFTAIGKSGTRRAFSTRPGNAEARAIELLGDDLMTIAPVEEYPATETRFWANRTGWGLIQYEGTRTGDGPWQIVYSAPAADIWREPLRRGSLGYRAAISSMPKGN